MTRISLLLTALMVGQLTLPATDAGKETYCIPLTIVSDLPMRNVPMDPWIDFAQIVSEASLDGILDANSIVVVDMETGKPVPHLKSDDFAHGGRGRIQWVVEDPSRKEYEIQFAVASQCSEPISQPYSPRIGTGDLLRYNNGTPSPIPMAYLSGLHDLTGDGKADLIGAWNYGYRAGWPWDCLFCYPRIGEPACLGFGDMCRLRHVYREGDTDYRFIGTTTYFKAQLADLNKDGLLDVACTARRDKLVRLYLNSGRRDEAGMPVFVSSGTLSHSADSFHLQAVDLNGDGATDFTVGNQYLENANPAGWPIETASPATIDSGRDPCFFDIDEDGLLDAICLGGGGKHGAQPVGYYVAWRKNLGGSPPSFGPEDKLSELDAFWASSLASIQDGSRCGILVMHDVYENISFYEFAPGSKEGERFRHAGRLLSRSAVMSLGDQSSPCVCDWDSDGDLDILIGSGYGWPRTVLNVSDDERPAYAEPERILSEGKPIRILMNEEFDAPDYWHNMGYSFPVFADWDGDGLKDLMLPNITNRIFWYENIGAEQTPAFGGRQELVCEGYPITPERLAKTAERLLTEGEGHLDDASAFYWRTGAAFADWNGDGLMDFITHDGGTRKATLFAQTHNASGELRLQKERTLKLDDGRLIDDSIVGRSSNWTESFRATDWDGDGLVDLVYGCAGSHGKIQDGGSIFLLRNCGSIKEPVFEKPRTLRCFGEPIRFTCHGPHPWVGDMDGDGKPDVLAHSEWSTYAFYSHPAMTMESRPEYVLGKLKHWEE